MAATAKSAFYSMQRFAVVGASANRSKFGNKVFRCYLQHQRDVTPISISSASIEGVDCVKSVQDIDSLRDVALSVVTPPKVTRTVLEEAAKLGCNQFLLQPGTYDASVDAFIQTMEANVVKSCVLVDLGFEESSGL